MRYLDVCSGISAPTAAWSPLGWQALCYAEIEAAPRAVLAHHYPDVPLVGDFTQIRGDEYGPVDLLVGGTPCQSFSVAGLRGGLADERGNLALEYLRLADRARPRWLVWENVPGVLSSNGGRDFGTFLGALGELGYGFAYRVLDAQHFGVPQRRRRVFVVGYLGDWRCAAAVLFERHSLSGDSPPRRQAGPGTAGASARSLAIRGREGVPQAELGDEVANAILTPNGGRGGIAFGAVLCSTFNPQAGGKQTTIGYDESGLAGTLGVGQSQAVIIPLLEIGKGTTSRGEGPNGSGLGRDGDPMFTLQSGAQHGVAITPIDMRQASRGATMTNNRPPGSSGGAPGTGIGEPGDPSFTVATSHVPAIATSIARKLTPRECERLQGFPDDFTLVPYRKGMMADGPRYKMLGNSMAIPCVRWIGERIAAVDALSQSLAA